MNTATFRLIPLLILAVLIFFGAHYFLYYSVVRFFNIVGHVLRGTLLTVIFLLPISFFVSSALSHLKQSSLLNFFYIISASWLGLATCFLLAVCLIWLLIWLAGSANINFNVPVASVLIFFLAAAIFIYGIWNAFHPQVKNIEVKIKNLPLEWQNKTIVQLSDVHLGHIHGVKFLQDVVAKTNAQNPDLVLITGDLFDGMDGDLSVFIEALKNIKAKEGTFFVIGNHETFLGVDRAYLVLMEANIKVLDNEFVNLDGLQLVGLSYQGSHGAPSVTGRIRDVSEIFASLKERGLETTRPSILMHHAPTNIIQAKDNGINLQLSGHTHVGQLIPFGTITHLVYGKYYYGLHSEGDFSIYTSSGVGTWGPPVRIGNTPEIVSIKISRAD